MAANEKKVIFYSQACYNHLKGKYKSKSILFQFTQEPSRPPTCKRSIIEHAHKLAYCTKSKQNVKGGEKLLTKQIGRLSLSKQIIPQTQEQQPRNRNQKKKQLSHNRYGVPTVRESIMCKLIYGHNSRESISLVVCGTKLSIVVPFLHSVLVSLDHSTQR